MTNKIKEMKGTKKLFIRFIPFWIFLTLFKMAAGLHYTLVAPLGEHLLPLWEVGLLMGGVSFIQVLFDIPAGKLLDRFGYRRMLQITAFVFLFAGLALMMKFTLITYLISLALSVYGWLFYAPGINAYVLFQSPKKDTGTFMSFRDIFASTGIVLSSAILGIVLTLPVRAMGAIIFCVMLAAWMVLWFAPDDLAARRSQTRADDPLPTKRHSLQQIIAAIARLNPASTMLLLVNLAGSTFYGVIWFVVPLVIAHQVNSGLLSLGLGVFDFAIVILGFALGSLADRGNKRTLVFFGLLLFTIAGVLLGFNFSWIFLLLGFLATSGDEMASISLWAWLHALDRVHAEDGLVSGVLNLFDDLGWAIGPMVAGALYVAVGPSWTIAAGASLIFVALLIYQLFFMKHHVHGPVANLPRKPHRRRHRV